MRRHARRTSGRARGHPTVSEQVFFLGAKTAIRCCGLVRKPIVADQMHMVHDFQELAGSVRRTPPLSSIGSWQLRSTEHARVGYAACRSMSACLSHSAICFQLALFWPTNLSFPVSIPARSRRPVRLRRFGQTDSVERDSLWKEQLLNPPALLE